MLEEKEIKIKEEEENIKKIKEEDEVIKTENQNVEKLEKARRDAHAEKNKNKKGVFGAIVGCIAAICTGSILSIIASVGNLIGIASDATPEEAIREIEEKLNNARRNLQSSKEKKKDHQNQKDAANIEISRLSKEIKNKLELKSFCKEDSQKINERLQSCEQNLNESARKILEKNTSLQDKQSKMVIANENYNAAKQKREDVYSNINKLNSEISSIGKILDQSITQIISFVPTELTELAKKKTKIEGEIHGLNQKLRKIETDVKKALPTPSKLKI
jgi:DNA repair ATPase RecN